MVPEAVPEQASSTAPVGTPRTEGALLRRAGTGEEPSHLLLLCPILARDLQK